MKELPPALNPAEQQVHKEVNRHIDPSLGAGVIQHYQHSQGRTNSMSGAGEVRNFTLEDNHSSEEARLQANNASNMAEILDPKLDHSGTSHLDAKISKITPKGAMAKLRGKKPTTHIDTGGKVTLHRETRYDPTAPDSVPSYSTDIVREGKTFKTVNSKGELEDSHTVALGSKTTTHASKGNGPQEYEVKFSSEEKKQKYAELAQRLAVKGIKRASPKRSGYVKHLAHHENTRRAA